MENTFSSHHGRFDQVSPRSKVEGSIDGQEFISECAFHNNAPYHAVASFARKNVRMFLPVLTSPLNSRGIRNSRELSSKSPFSSFQLHKDQIDRRCSVSITSFGYLSTLVLGFWIVQLLNPVFLALPLASFVLVDLSWCC